jgi:uncharacterized protein YjbI with pentapeptide repeats
LVHANLSGQWLPKSDLKEAKLDLAKLSGSTLTGANLRGADLFGANLSDADLREADLTDVTNLDQACGNEKTKLPEGLTIKPCPPRELLSSYSESEFWHTPFPQRVKRTISECLP